MTARTRSSRLLLAVAALLAVVSGAPAQSVESREDSALVRQLRGQQQRFEWVRRNHLPWAWSGGRGECDERIGRFCLSHGSGGDDWEPEPEHERITSARQELLEALRVGATRLSESGWIAGQRVRYLVEAGRYEEAIEAAAACGAGAWWCNALTGFGLHYAGEAAAADSAFSSALSVMPDRERERWNDLSLLLDDCSLRHYRRLPDAEKRAFEHRFWRLADPFHTRPGNETRSEHLARHVWDALQDRAASAEGLAWADDLREILLRYGWPEGWERVRGEPLRSGPPAMVSHYAGSDRDLLPPCEVLRDGDLIAGEWDQEPPQPRTGYAIPMPDSVVTWIGGVDYQVAVFQRGDSAVVVAGYEIPADSLRAEAPVEAGVVVLTPSLERAAVASFPQGGRSDVVSLATPQGPLLLTIEATAWEARRAARVRYGIDVARSAPGLIGLSDLLLLSSSDHLPDSLGSAVPLTRRSTRVSRGERVGVYWEVYGLEGPDGEDLSFSVRLLEQDAGWIRGLGRMLGVIDDTPPVLVRWRESPGPREVFARSATVTIPHEIRAGPYLLELTVTAAGREPLSIRRAIRVQEN